MTTGSPGYIDAFKAVEAGFAAWKAKAHNRKWARRIDGTPIENDLSVCIAQEVMKLLEATRDFERSDLEW